MREKTATVFSRIFCNVNVRQRLSKSQTLSIRFSTKLLLQPKTAPFTQQKGWFYPAKGHVLKNNDKKALTTHSS